MSGQRCICHAPLERRGFTENFDLLRCPVCRSGRFVDRNSDTLMEYAYDSSDEKYGSEAYLNAAEFRWAHELLLKKPWQGRRVLEVGCFTGFFIDALRKKGADVWGLEVNRHAAETGEKLYGLEGRILADLTAAPDDLRFDDIIMIDVLEHLSDPEQVLQQLSKRLAPGGRITISSPTIERFFNDKSDFPPHHQWWFSRKGLRELLRHNDLPLSADYIQRDGLLFIRNFIGRAINGMFKREFHGEGSATVSAVARTFDGTRLYGVVTAIAAVPLNILRLQYCSYLVQGAKAP